MRLRKKKKKTCPWFLMHLLGLHISRKMKGTAMMIMGASILIPWLPHWWKTMEKGKKSGHIGDASSRKILLFLMTLLALLSSTSPRWVHWNGIAYNQCEIWRFCNSFSINFTEQWFHSQQQPSFNGECVGFFSRLLHNSLQGTWNASFWGRLWNFPLFSALFLDTKLVSCRGDLQHFRSI